MDEPETFVIVACTGTPTMGSPFALVTIPVITPPLIMLTFTSEPIRCRGHSNGLPSDVDWSM